MNLHAEVFEDHMELDIELLQAVPLSAESPDFSSYPYPRLSTSGKRQTAAFRTLVLENQYLKVVILPDLGGRITSFFDKRTGMEMLDQGFEAREAGPRGVEIAQGLRFALTPARLNDLGPVDFALGEDEDIASITLAEHSGVLSWHLILTLPHDQAILQIEGRVYNRSWKPIHYDARFEIAGSGLYVLWAPDDRAAKTRLSQPRFLMPCQLDAWGAQIVAGPDDAVAVTSLGALRLGESLGFLATKPVLGKMYIQLDTGQNLEAPIEIFPDQPFSAPLPGNVSAVGIHDQEHENIFAWFSSHPMTAPIPALPESEVPTLEDHFHNIALGLSIPADLDSLDFDLRTKAATRRLRAIQAFHKQNYKAARVHLDDALMYSAEDHLLWLMKATAARKLGEETEDLLNAHYLAPLDPLLRMESFLAQNHQTKEKSPLVAPIAENPDALIEAACFLYELNQFDDLARWVDECLRHREVPMLRYILANALFTASPMSVDAAGHVTRAAQTPIDSQYPYRIIEGWVLNCLHHRFPQDERLAELYNLYQRANPPFA